MRLVQLRNGRERRVAIVEEPQLRLLDGVSSVYSLAEAAIRDRAKLTELARKAARAKLLPYDEIYSGKSEWTLMVPIDHPVESARCLVSGTGLTHLGSTKNRQPMHEIVEADVTDSMKMFRRGVERGRTAADAIGVAPEWFHKGTGNTLRAHNYLNLAGSKLRQCSLSPELVVDAPFESVNVDVVIVRGGTVLWSQSFLSGESGMCHSLQNLEHHHFKFEAHQRPGDIHVHFFGTAALSFSDGIQLHDGDVMQALFEGFGRSLRNRFEQ